MFRHRIMGQNVKRLLTVAAFWGSKRDPDQIMPSTIYQVVRLTPGITKMMVFNFTRYFTCGADYRVKCQARSKTYFYVSLNLLTSVSAHNCTTRLNSDELDDTILT